MSRFPLISETFILSEILELERLGFRVEVFPLIREYPAVVHPEALRIAERTRHQSPFSASSLAAQLYWLRTQPRAYLRTWWRAIWGNRTSPRFLLRAFFVVPQAAAYARCARRLGVRHIHAHYATHPALAAYTVTMLTGIPYSFTAHAHDIYVERPMLAEKIRRARFVVTISDYNKSLLQELYGACAARKTFVVRCGVDPDLFTPRSTRRTTPATLICVASLQDYKGHEYLIQACARLKREGRDFRCVLVGDGDDRDHIVHDVRDRGLQGEVVFAGAQPRERVRELLRESNVLVLPSVVTESGKKEGLPVVLMEALASGLPVVASAISGVPELIRHRQTGLLVPQRDSAALANAIGELLDDPALRERLSRAGREHVIEHYEIRKNVRRLAELLATP
jgi:colanic acid/amylovoran biosynthesis glycosyltransferase